MADTVRLGGFASRTQAVLAQGFLADQGIASSVVTDDAGGAAPFVALGSHGVALLVPTEHADRARRLLEELGGDDTPAAPTPRSWPALLGRALLVLVVLGIILALVAQATGR